MGAEFQCRLKPTAQNLPSEGLMRTETAGALGDQHESWRKFKEYYYYYSVFKVAAACRGKTTSRAVISLSE